MSNHCRNDRLRTRLRCTSTTSRLHVQVGSLAVCPLLARNSVGLGSPVSLERRCKRAVATNMFALMFMSNRRCAAIPERAGRQSQTPAYANLSDPARLSHRCIPVASHPFSLSANCGIGCGHGSCGICSDLPKIRCGTIHNSTVCSGRTSWIRLYISAWDIRRVLQRRVHNDSDCGLCGVLPLVIPGSDGNDKVDKHLFICNRNERLYVARTR